MRMIVCDMAGTIINENGLVYKTLFNTLKKIGVKEDIKTWYGLEKRSVINTMVDKYGPYGDNRQLKKSIYLDFQNNLHNAYFGKKSKLSLIHPNIPNYFNELREKNMVVTLNTGYNREFQKKLIDHFNMESYIDDYISSEDVPFGRPEPFMIHKLMRRNNIEFPKDVIKVGDTKIDMLEGKSAGCGMIVGVLSGADNKKELSKYSTLIIDNIVNLKI
jgi:phosphonatase-like hydrolase